MGYERNDRRYGGQGGGSDRYRGDYGRDPGGYNQDRHPQDYRGRRFNDERSEDRGSNRGYRDYGRDPTGYDYQDRGFFDRAGDEVRSWFGDEDAERRRQADDRNHQRDYGRNDRYGYVGGRYAAYGAGDIGGGYAPGDYGAGPGAGATGSWGLGAGRDRHDWGHDAGYTSWRDRQIQSFDKDYDDYRREHQQKFDSEFHSWRQNRQGQRDQLRTVQEHFEVVGSDGQHVGVVDHVRADAIQLTKNDKDADGHHHSIPSSWIQSVEDGKVTISKTADQAKQHWRDKGRNGGNDFFGNRDRTLNRSFSGTY